MEIVILRGDMRKLLKLSTAIVVAAFVASTATTLGVYFAYGLISLNLMDVLVAAVASAAGAGIAAIAAIYAAKTTIKPAEAQLALQSYALLQGHLEKVRTDYDTATSALQMLNICYEAHATDTFLVDRKFHPKTSFEAYQSVKNNLHAFSDALKLSSMRYPTNSKAFILRSMVASDLRKTSNELLECVLRAANFDESSSPRPDTARFITELSKMSERISPRIMLAMDLILAIYNEEATIQLELPKIIPAHE